MSYIDLHADTITELCEGETLSKNAKMIDLQELIQAGCKIQFFSSFVDMGMFGRVDESDSSDVPELSGVTGVSDRDRLDDLAWNRYEKIRSRYQNTLTDHREQLMAVTSVADLEQCLRSDRIGTVFTIEEGGELGGDMKKLQRAYEDGVRLITLTWNYENAIGYPNSLNSAIMKKGLKPFGLDMIEEMNHLGMIIDVSHLSDGGFWDVYRHSKAPFVASHSNTRALCQHPRNLTDEMIRAIAERGGVVGLNLYGPFLGSDHTSRVSDMVRHVHHLYQVGGAEILALGSDFDGIDGTLEIGRPTELMLLFEALERSGLSGAVIDKMKMENGLRVLREVLK